MASSITLLTCRTFSWRLTQVYGVHVYRCVLVQGPGDYNPKMKPRYHVEMPGSSPFMSGVPKCDHRLQAGPGPGQYAHYSPLGVNTSASNVPCLSSSAQRGAWLRSDEVRGQVPTYSYEICYTGYQVPGTSKGTLLRTLTFFLRSEVIP